MLWLVAQAGLHGSLLGGRLGALAARAARAQIRSSSSNSGVISSIAHLRSHGRAGALDSGNRAAARPFRPVDWASPCAPVLLTAPLGCSHQRHAAAAMLSTSAGRGGGRSHDAWRVRLSSQQPQGQPAHNPLLSALQQHERAVTNALTLQALAAAVQAASHTWRRIGTPRDAGAGAAAPSSPTAQASRRLDCVDASAVKAYAQVVRSACGRLVQLTPALASPHLDLGIAVVAAQAAGRGAAAATAHASQRQGQVDASLAAGVNATALLGRLGQEARGVLQAAPAGGAPAAVEGALVPYLAACGVLGVAPQQALVEHLAQGMCTHLQPPAATRLLAVLLAQRPGSFTPSQQQHVTRALLGGRGTARGGRAGGATPQSPQDLAALAWLWAQQQAPQRGPAAAAAAGQAHWPELGAALVGRLVAASAAQRPGGDARAAMMALEASTAWASRGAATPSDAAALQAAWQQLQRTLQLSDAAPQRQAPGRAAPHPSLALRPPRGPGGPQQHLLPHSEQQQLPALLAELAPEPRGAATVMLRLACLEDWAPAAARQKHTAEVWPRDVSVRGTVGPGAHLAPPRAAHPAAPALAQGAARVLQQLALLPLAHAPWAWQALQSALPPLVRVLGSVEVGLPAWQLRRAAGGGRAGGGARDGGLPARDAAGLITALGRVERSARVAVASAVLCTGPRSQPGGLPGVQGQGASPAQRSLHLPSAVLSGQAPVLPWLLAASAPGACGPATNRGGAHPAELCGVLRSAVVR